MAEYQHACVSVAGFIQQLAVSYVAKGYWFYVCGVVPERKDPAKTDRKIMAQYGVGISKWARARKKKAGQANLHYLRHERFWVVIATPGESPFFAAEGQGVRDIPSSRGSTGGSRGCPELPAPLQRRTGFPQGWR